MLKQLKKISSSDRAVNQLQENVEQVLSPIVDKEILDGILIKDVQLITGQLNKINHLLGKRLTGYTVVRQNANATIWDSQDLSLSQSRTLTLNCSANVKISLWVF